MFVYLIQVQTAENINKIAGPGMDKWTPPSRGIVNQTPEWFTIPDSSSSVCDCPIPIVAFSLLLLSSFPPPSQSQDIRDWFLLNPSCASLHAQVLVNDYKREIKKYFIQWLRVFKEDSCNFTL